MASTISTIPIWLYLLTFVLMADAVATVILVQPKDIDYGNRTPPPPHIQRNIIRFMWCMAALHIGVLVFFCMGFNWARILVLISCTFSVFTKRNRSKLATQSAKNFSLATGVLSVFTFVFLLLPPIAAHFTASK